MDKNSLTHWGIKGMKWGVRRYQNPDGTLTEAGKRRQRKNLDNASADYKRARAKPMHEMSDAELRSAINRIQMEKQYSSLNAKEKSFGRKFVENTLSESGKQIATHYITKYAKIGIDKGIDAAVKKFKKA